MAPTCSDQSVSLLCFGQVKRILHWGCRDRMGARRGAGLLGWKKCVRWVNLILELLENSYFLSKMVFLRLKRRHPGLRVFERRTNTALGNSRVSLASHLCFSSTSQPSCSCPSQADCSLEYGKENHPVTLSWLLIFYSKQPSANQDTVPYRLRKMVWLGKAMGPGNKECGEESQECSVLPQP